MKNIIEILITIINLNFIKSAIDSEGGCPNYMINCGPYCCHDE